MEGEGGWEAVREMMRRRCRRRADMKGRCWLDVMKIYILYIYICTLGSWEWGGGRIVTSPPLPAAAATAAAASSSSDSKSSHGTLHRHAGEPCVWIVNKHMVSERMPCACDVLYV